MTIVQSRDKTERKTMQTKSIRAENQKGQLKAYITIEDPKSRNILTYPIKYPRNRQPYYYIKRERIDLNEHEISLLRNVIACVDG